MPFCCSEVRKGCSCSRCVPPSGGSLGVGSVSGMLIGNRQGIEKKLVSVWSSATPSSRKKTPKFFQVCVGDLMNSVPAHFA